MYVVRAGTHTAGRGVRPNCPQLAQLSTVRSRVVVAGSAIPDGVRMSSQLPSRMSSRVSGLRPVCGLPTLITALLLGLSPQVQQPLAPAVPASRPPAARSAALLARLPGTAAGPRAAVAPAPASGRYRPAAGFSWPLAGSPPVLRPFTPPRTPYGPGHRGVDLGGRIDEPVLAAADGLVVFAGALAGRGVVSIEHEGLLRSTYEPLRPSVSVGAMVRRGEQIGLLDPGHPDCPLPAHAQARANLAHGADLAGGVAVPSRVDDAGSAVNACLHWGLRRRLDYLDPVWLFGSRIRLLPWTDPPTEPALPPG